MPKPFVILLTLLFLCFCTSWTGCGRDAGHARNDLLKMNYAVTPDDFVRAARAGDLKAVSLFLDAGIEPGVETATGTTALIGAAENNATAILKLLLERGADPGHKDKEGWTALMKAVYGGKQAAVDILAGVAKEELNSALLLASLLGHTDTARTLLEHGAEIDTTGEDGSTPLMFAVKSGNADLVKLLLDSHADTSLTNKSGATAPDMAMARGDAKILALLVPDHPETSPTPEVGATPTVVLSQEIPAVFPPKKTPRPSSEEAWWKKFGLDPDAPGVIDADTDGDHISNGEEFLADTSPIDPSSHPAFASRLKWVSYHQVPLPFSLVSISGKKAVLRARDKTVTELTEGESANGWTATLISSSEGQDKDGHSYDASKVILQNAAGEKIRLLPGITSPNTESYARVRLPFSDEDLQLHTGDTFNIPGEHERTYQVLDLRPRQVVIKELKSGATFTVEQ